MRALNALLRALRTRRKHPETDPVASTDHPGLADLLDAARAPATMAELAGEKEAVAAFAAHRRTAARSERKRRVKARVRVVLVPVTAGLALLALAGTAVAARTGNLPQEAQQHAHRLFSALGVPAPRTGNPLTPSPAPSPSRPGPRPTLDVTALSWCQAWGGGPARTLSHEDRRKLSAAAGGEDGIEKYCRDLHKSASAQPSEGPSAPPGPPSGTPSPSGPAAPPGPAASVPAPATTEPGRPTPPGQPPTTPPGKPPKPTHTGKPTDTPPGKDRENRNTTQRHNPASPSVAALLNDSAESGHEE
ncbi:hypothetical protein M1L60_43145 [Actinoplanes sp. TRM 88003]|uniref:Uncharacterized protein n=1 Tax=Paractinoplanes aksuensis TaxID=2939490 RepID=A0ABT1E2M9_9ACTN|nr:hypothetical protein [Actinoplanes aksuensis]MCO8277396.1 hypothetical protein [Actinoplanes aksuensis]